MSLRNADKVELVNVRCLKTGGEKKMSLRTFFRVEFIKKPGASTPGQRGNVVVTLHHTRSGSQNTGMNIAPGDRGVRFKTDRPVGEGKCAVCKDDGGRQQQCFDACSECWGTCSRASYGHGHG